MTVAAELIVEIKGRSVNLDTLIKRIEADLRRLDASGQRTSTTMGGAFQSGVRGATALQTAQTQLARSTANNVSLMRQFGDAAKSSMLGIIGPAAAAGVAIGALSQAGELIQLGTQITQTRQAFNGLAEQAGTTGDAILAALRKASSGTISDLNLQLAANKAQLLGVADSAEEFSTLMEIARDRAQKMGISTTQAFNDLVTGLGRGSALILDNLGITVSVTEANEAYAASLGKTASQLTDAESKQALINAVLVQGQANIAATGGAMNTMASDVERAAASWENLKGRIGEGLAALLGPALSGANQLFALNENITGASQAAFTGAQNFQQYGERIAFVNQQLGGLLAVTPLTEAQFAFARSLIETGTAADQAFAKAQAMASEFQQLSAILDTASFTSSTTAAALTGLVPQIAQVAAISPEASEGILTMAAAVASNELSIENFRAALAGLIGHYEAVRQAAALDRIEQEQLTRSSGQAAQAFSVESTALAENTSKTLEGQIQAQKLAEFQSVLANLGGAVAAGHTTAGNAALALANKYNIARDAALGLINMQAQLAGVQVRAARQGGLSLSEQREGRGELELLAQRNAQIKASEAAAAAERRYQQSLGNTGPELAHLRGELAKTTKGSAEYFDTLTKIQNLSRTGGSGRGGGGGVKLSDQQKLSIQLLSDQEKFQDKSEDLELKHGLKLLSIERDTNEKRAAAAKAFQQARADSDASFYRSIGDIQDNGIQQLASAQFEDALSRSEEIGRTKGRDAAKAYLEARREAILQDAKTQEEINKALAEGDGGRAEFLQGIQAKERTANDERLRQIEESGSAIENERARQIAEEERSYEESQGRVADQAETSAARRIAANERAGKAIDPERIAVQNLTADYEKLGRVSGRGAVPAGAASATPTTTAAPGTAPTGTAAPADMAAVVAAVTALQDRLDKLIGLAGDEVNATRSVVSAVGGRAFS